MITTVLHIMKRYQGNYPLLNAMVSTDRQRFRTIVCYLGGAADGNNQIEGLVERTLYLQLDKKAVSWTRLATLRAVTRLIDAEAVDLVVCQFRRTIPIGAFATALSTRTPKVIGVLHGIVGGKFSASLRLLNWFVFKRLSRLVSVSVFDTDQIIRSNWGLDPKKVVVIQNGIDLHRFLEPVAVERAALFGEHFVGKTLLGTVGRLAGKKNHARLLEAMAAAHRDCADTALIIVGVGPEEAALKALAERLGIAEQVLFTGRRGDISAILQGLDIFVFPSLREGLPLALIEAMAAGLPVIASHGGGVGETLGDADCGWRVDPTDTASIADAIRQAVATSPQERRRRGDNARQRALDHFNAERMIAAYEQLYEDVLHDP
ncbi:MAG: glycosyltransferase [Porticoccaceae bacterium]